MDTESVYIKESRDNERATKANGFRELSDMTNLTDQAGNGEMPLLAHLNELRHKLIISIVAIVLCFIISFISYDYIVYILLKPFQAVNSSIDGNSLFITTIFEGFVVRLKVSALAALVLSSPVHVFNLLSFVFPGLHKNERKIISITLFCSFIFIIISFFYSYYSILPVSITFLTNQGFIPGNTGLLLNFGSNVTYILQFLLVALVVFQIPVILEILLVMNVLSRKVLIKYGRYVIILFFIISALLTPPDFVTQVGLALPLTVLYFLTILVAKIFKFGEE